MAWQVMFASFWSFLLAMIAVSGGRIDTAWLAYTVSIGGGLFIGLMYMFVSPGSSDDEDALAAQALPLGRVVDMVGQFGSTGVRRQHEPAWSEAFVGTMAASVFIVPLAVVMAMLASRANGLAKMATLYLHNETLHGNGRRVPRRGDRPLAAFGRPLQPARHRALEGRRRRSCRCRLPESDRADAAAAEAHMNQGRRLHAARRLRSRH